MEKHQEAEEMWRAELTGKSPRLRHLRLWLKLLPSEPRCKLCNAPFHGLGRPIAAILGRQRSRKNPRFCNYCETIARTYRGGAEVELTLLFVDVRGSTTLAEGEILMSEATYAAAGLAGENLERRELTLKGRTESVGVRVLRVAS